MGEKTALVTGASGFIGSHLTRRLVANGWETHIVCRKDSNLSMLNGITEHITEHRHYGSTAELVDIMEATTPDVVFHLASLFVAEHSVDQVASLINSNLLFSTQIVESMARTGTTRLVNTGTCWQHYNNEDYNPVNLYAATKQAFEDILRYYGEVHQFKMITLKLSDTYGPNDPRAKLLNLLIRSIHRGEWVQMSPGEQMIDLVYIDDVVSAYLLAARDLLTNSVPRHTCYTVSSGNGVRLRELVATLEHICNRPLKIQWGAKSYRRREIMHHWESLSILTGWYPTMTLANGIKKTVEVNRQEVLENRDAVAFDHDSDPNMQ